MRRVSQKQAKINAEYSRLRKDFLMEHPICEVCHSLPATQVHHKLRRGINTLNVASWLAVDHLCHAKIEENGKWAREQGYLL